MLPWQPQMHGQPLYNELLRKAFLCHDVTVNETEASLKRIGFNIIFIRIIRRYSRHKDKTVVYTFMVILIIVLFACCERLVDK